MSTNEVVDTNGVGRRRNRSWPDELKREIVAASLEPGASVAGVARRYGVNDNQLFSWRKRYREGLLGPGGAALVPVTIAADPAGVSVTVGLGDTIEIDAPGGYRVRVGSGGDGKALHRVLDALAGR